MLGSKTTWNVSDAILQNPMWGKDIGKLAQTEDSLPGYWKTELSHEAIPDYKNRTWDHGMRADLVNNEEILLRDCKVRYSPAHVRTPILFWGVKISRSSQHSKSRHFLQNIYLFMVATFLLILKISRLKNWVNFFLFIDQKSNYSGKTTKMRLGRSQWK